MALHELLVRLGLQAKEFQNGLKNVTADLKQVEKNTQNTTTVMKASWRDLGIKSTEYINAQKASVTKAYETIRVSGLYSAQEVLRAEQAKNQKIEALNKQAAVSQIGLMDSIKKNWFAVMGAMAAGAAVTSFLKGTISDYMEEEKAVMKLAVAMRNQGDYTREALDALRDYASQLQKTTVYGDELTLSVMGNLKSYGMNTEELKKATEATMDLATAKGMDLLAASELLGKAFVGETGTLARYGIVLAEGTEKSKKFETVLRLINERFGGAAQAEIETYSGQLKVMANWWGDIKEKIGFGLLKSLEAVQFSLGMVASGFYTMLEKVMQGYAKLMSWGGKLPDLLGGKAFRNLAQEASITAEVFGDIGRAAASFAEKNYRMMISATRTEDAVEKMGRGLKGTTGNIKDNTKATKEAAEAQKKLMDAAEESEQAYSKMYSSMKFLAAGYVDYAKKKLEEDRDNFINATGNKTLANQWYWAELNKLYHDQLHGLTQLEKEQAQESIKVAKNKLAELNKNMLSLSDPAEWKKINDTIGAAFFETFGGVTRATGLQKEQMKDMTAAYNQMYSDLKGNAETYYDFLKGNLEKQAKDYARMTGDKAMAAAWLTEKLKQLDIEKGKSSESFFAGVKAGYLELTNSLYTWGQAGYDIFKTFTGAMSSTFSSVFKDAIAGNLKSFGDYFKSFWDTMLNKFVDILAQMLAEWLILQAAMKASQWFGFGAAGGTQSGGNKAAGVGQNVVQNVGTTALYNYLFGGGSAMGASFMASGGGSLAASELGWAASMQAGGETVAATGGTGSMSAAWAAAAPYAVPIGAAIVVQQVIQHGEEWLYAAMGGKEQTSDVRRIIQLLSASAEEREKMVTPMEPEDFGMPVFSLNPSEFAQYQRDRAAEQKAGADMMKGLMESSLYAQMSANPPAGYTSWEEYAQFQRSLPSMHGGGIIKAHSGLYLASDERIIVGQTGERVLNREQTKDYDRGRYNEQPIVVNVYLDSQKIQRSIYQATKYGEPIIYEGGITNR